MKKLALLFLFCVMIQQSILAEVSVFAEKKRFGLKDETGTIIVDAKYKKLIRLGEQAWIMQDGTKFGIVHDSGKVLIEPKYSQAERVLGKFAKLKRGTQYYIVDDMGFYILSDFNSIDLIQGGMFVTSKNHKFGLYNLNGEMVVDNIFDDIYMNGFDTLVIVYGNKLYEFEKKQKDAGSSFDIIMPQYMETNDVKVSDIASSPIASTGYYSITFTDYMLKLISSISPAYEQTIDELMFSQGADTVSVLFKLSWIPKFPFVYTKNYYQNVIDPYNGPLSTIKRNMKQKIKNSSEN